MKKIGFLLLFMLATLYAGDTITVDIHNFPPCVITEGKTPKGFDIDIMEHIAKELDLTMQYREIEHFADIHNNLKNGTTDLAAAGISITGDREQYSDFSYPYLASGLSILVRDESSISLFEVIKTYFKNTWKALLVFLLFLFFCSVVIWWLEKGFPSFNDNFVKGVSDGLYWTNTTMTTVGYGDKTPQTPKGKAFSIFVMWIGIVVVFPYVVASMSVSMNYENDKTEITSKDDLRGIKIATKKDITAHTYADECGAAVIAKPTIDECYKLLKNREVDAVIYDMPSLSYFMNNGGDKDFKLVGGMFDRQGYGFAMPQGSQLREKINTVLIEFMRTDEYWELHKKWFGE